MAGCCPCLKSSSHYCPCVSNSSTATCCPSGSSDSVRMRDCCAHVSSRILFDYFIVCTTQYAVSVRTAISHLVTTGHVLLTERTCLGFFCLRNSNVPSIAVRVPAWKDGSCRVGDSEINSGSIEVAYWRTVFFIFCTSLKCWNSILN